MDLKEIKLLIDLMKKNDLSVFKMEKEGFKITLKKSSGFEAMVSLPAAGVAPLPTVALPLAPSLPAAAPAPAAAEPDKSAGLKEVVSPMVGTFYRAASPESPPYVTEGQEITEDTVVCLIEAMKVMNEIKAEVRGVVAEILVENGKPVQFGQPLLKVK